MTSPLTTEVEVLPKDWYRSKTHLVQVVAAISSLGVTFFGWDVLNEGTIFAIVLLIQVVGNGLTMVIRQYTNRPTTPMVHDKAGSRVEAIPVEPSVKEAARAVNMRKSK